MFSNTMLMNYKQSWWLSVTVFFGFLLKKAIFKNKMFHLGTKHRRVYWYRTLYVSVRNKVFKLIKHALALNYRTLNLTIMALHVYLGDEPLTEGIKRCLMRVKGMAEMTWKQLKSAFPGKRMHTNSGRRTFPSSMHGMRILPIGAVGFLSGVY